MREARLIEVRDVHPNEIETSGRLRPVSDAAVESLIASINELGVIKDEIIVRKVRHRGGKLVLVAGAHRLEACRRMNRLVPAKIYDCSDDWARLMEVDDNLAGAELNALDTAVFMAARKRVYEQLHPETKRGIAGAKARWDATDIEPVASFAKATAEKFGMTDRHIRRVLAAGDVLGPDEARRLRSAPRPVTLKDLTEISKIEAPVERYDVVEALAEGKARTASEARKAYAARQIGAPETAPKDPVEEAFKALATAWKRAPMAARRRFVEQENVALFNMLRELDGELSECRRQCRPVRRRVQRRIHRIRLGRQWRVCALCRWHPDLHLSRAL